MNNSNLLSIEEICGLMSNDTWRCLVPKKNMPPAAFWDEITAQKMIRDFLRTTLLNKVIYGSELMIPASNVLVAFLMDRDIALVFNPLSGECVFWFKDGFLDGSIKAPSMPDLSGKELWDMMPRHPEYRDEGYKSRLDREDDSDSEFELPLDWDPIDDLVNDTAAGFGPMPKQPKVVAADSEFELMLELDDDDKVQPVLKSVVEGEGVHDTAQGFIDSMGQIHRPGVPEAEILPDEEQNEIEIKDDDDDIRVVSDEPKN